MGKKVVFCNCGAKLISAERLEEIAEFLKQTGTVIVQISDLCGCSITRKKETYEIFGHDDEFLIIACYPRAVRLLLEDCGVVYSTDRFNHLNFRELDNPAILDRISAFLDSDVQKGIHSELHSNTEWPSWFPAIDYSRCTACGQCADFCLFGVYQKTDKRVVVINPQGCKNNCPACGRICPQTAIVFPKYDQGGAISGADTIDEIAEQQRQKHDVDTILGSNIYKALEMRKAKRQSIIRSEAMRKAIEERDIAKNEGIKE
ncbi:MAG: 4Fe-4S binding protein [Mariniphaga sp.]